MWITDYVNLIFKEEIQNHEEFLENIGKAQKLKRENIPPKLYKYFSTKSYNIDCFKEDFVFLNKPQNFNDPFDCCCTCNTNNLQDEFNLKLLKQIVNTDTFKLSESEKQSILKSQNLELAISFIAQKNNTFAGQEDKILSVYKETIANHIKQMAKPFYKRAQDGIIVSCFSQSNNIITMWSHYTNNHSGFCLEYNFTKLPNSDIRKVALLPVIYKKKPLDISKFLFKDNPNNLFYKYITMVKREEWAYEKEWRIVIEDCLKAPYWKVPTPEAIYLGVNISSQDKKLLIDIAQKKEIKIYQMIINNEEGEICFEQISF